VTGWIHGFLGKGVRIEIPDCVRDEIIALTPEDDHVYVGFRLVGSEYDSSVRTTSDKENDNAGEQAPNHDRPRKRMKETVAVMAPGDTARVSNIRHDNKE